MSGRRSPATPIKQTFEQFLLDKGKGDGGETGNYRRNVEAQLDRFHRWATGGVRDPANADPPESWTGIADGADVTFEDLDARVFSDYVRFLTSKGYATTTQNTYYSYVSSWCKWAYQEGYIQYHYARQSDATRNLEEPDGKQERQAWAQADRDRLTRYVDEQADAALDAFHEVDVPDGEWGELQSSNWQLKQTMRFRAIKAVRKRAFVYSLAYTGLRGAEFLRDKSDSREGRHGLRWDDVDLADGSMTVYRKDQHWKESAIPDPVIRPLKTYRERLDPPAEWPVFTTLHNPTLAAHTVDRLEAAGYNQESIEEMREAKSDILILADEDMAAPPALTTDGGRTLMRSLTEAAGIELDDDRVHDYLAPHGARRGMGEVMVREYGFAEAARYLDNSEEQVREAYSHIEAAERAELASDAISRTDHRVSGDSEGDPDR